MIEKEFNQGMLLLGFKPFSYLWNLCFSVIQGLVAVLVYGIVFYPYFACLTTKNKLIGSLIGFVYAASRYETVMIIIRASGSVRKKTRK